VSTPAALAGLALWLDGGQTAYSDAGTTVATVPYGRVAQIAQPAPLSGNITASGNARPWRETAALDFHSGDPNFMVFPAPASPVPANNCTIALAWQSRGGQQTMPLFYATHTAGTDLAMYMQGGAFVLQSPAYTAVIPGLTGIQPGHNVTECTLLLTCTPTQFEIRLTINGVSQTLVIPTAPTAGTLSAFQIGRWTGYANSHLAVSQYVVYSQALSSADQGDLQAYLLSKPVGNPPIAASTVTILGDSVGSGWRPAWQTALNGLANPPRALNVAAAGTGTTNPDQIPAFYLSDALPRYDPARPKNILVCQGISINDVSAGLGTLTPSQVAAIVLPAYKSVCRRGMADGFLVIACTLSAVFGDARFEAARQIINADLKATWPTFAHRLANVGEVLTQADMNPSLSLSIDGTHLAEGGYLRWDPVLVAELIRLLTDQYLSMRAMLGRALAANSFLVANPSDGEVLSFFAQLTAEASGAAALPSAQQAAIGYAFRGLLSGNFPGISNPSDANVLDFWTQLRADSSGAPALSALRYQTLKAQLRNVVALNYPGAANPSLQALLGYFNAV